MSDPEIIDLGISDEEYLRRIAAGRNPVAEARLRFKHPERFGLTVEQNDECIHLMLKLCREGLTDEERERYEELMECGMQKAMVEFLLNYPRPEL